MCSCSYIAHTAEYPRELTGVNGVEVTSMCSSQPRAPVNPGEYLPRLLRHVWFGHWYTTSQLLKRLISKLVHFIQVTLYLVQSNICLVFRGNILPPSVWTVVLCKQGEANKTTLTLWCQYQLGWKMKEETNKETFLKEYIDNISWVKKCKKKNSREG